MPIFVFDRAGDLDIDIVGGPSGMEAIDVSDGEYPAAYSLSGDRIRIEVRGHPQTGDVVFVATGENALGELEARVRAYAERVGLSTEDTGDLLIDVANALAMNDWQSRWPKRPGWLSRRMHGTGPARFARP